MSREPRTMFAAVRFAFEPSEELLEMEELENITVEVRDAAGVQQIPPPLHDYLWLALIGTKKIAWLAVSEKGLRNKKLSFQACLVDRLAERYFEESKK